MPDHRARRMSRTYVRGWRCSHCGTDHIEPQTALFRYNSPLAACPVCEGTGRTMELDLSRIVPDPSKTIRQGAIAPWSIPAFAATSMNCWPSPPSSTFRLIFPSNFSMRPRSSARPGSLR